MSVPSVESEPPAVVTPPIRPLFRWPGGKRWLVPRLVDFVPSDMARYYEPFFGGGALFLAVRPSKATISDSNAELMDCYRAIRDDPLAISKALGQLGRDRKTYIWVRCARPTDATERAARLVYLTTLAFNGIYRVNRQGEFNVPYGGRTYDDLGNEARLKQVADALRGVDILSGDFEKSVRDAGPKDFVYLDPPYTVTHSNNGFLRYNDRIFSWWDQTRLAKLAEELSQRGCTVVVSNANHPSVVEMYPAFRAIVVERLSAMAALAKKRGTIEEVILTNAPAGGGENGG